MWDNILELAISDGLWALLFCMLLIYQLKDSKAREVKYQSTISSLAQDLEYMKDLDETIEDMEQSFREYTESMIKQVCEGMQNSFKDKDILTTETAKESA